MPKQLYEEALADVRQVREAAEADAKRALVEILAPRIKRLVESELMADLSEDACDDDEEVLQDDSEPVAEATSDVVDGEPMATPEGQPQPQTKPDGTHLTPADLLSSAIPDDDIDARLESFEADVSMYEGTSQRMRKNSAFSSAISKTIASLDDSYGYVQENVSDSERKVVLEGRLERVYQRLTMIQETVGKMAKQRINEEDVTLKLTGLPDDLDLENIGIDLITDSEGEEGVEGDDGLDSAGDAGEGDDLDLDFGGDEGEEPALEAAEFSDDTVVEIDDEMLQSEIARIQGALTESDHPANIIDDFGDGKSIGDPLDVDITTESTDEDVADKQAKVAEGVLQRATQRLQKLKSKLVEARTAKNARLANVILIEMKRTNKRINGAKTLIEGKTSKGASAPKNVVNENRTMHRQAETADTKKLRTQLAESNLYVAKLEHANKLLQNGSLNSKQKTALISKLDEAKSVRDVKLIYDTATKQSAQRGRIAESHNRVVGTSSGVVKPGSKNVVNEGVDLDKWARMAGIK